MATSKNQLYENKGLRQGCNTRVARKKGCQNEGISLNVYDNKESQKSAERISLRTLNVDEK
jgi:hypothetical protein